VTTRQSAGIVRQDEAKRGGLHLEPKTPPNRGGEAPTARLGGFGTFMLDTCICAFIMRERPVSVLERLAEAVARHDRIVISAITYAEMRYGQIGKKVSPRHKIMIDEFVVRLDEILPWGQSAVDATIEVKRHLTRNGEIIGQNDTAIAGHAIAAGCTLVTNNVREFRRVPALVFEDWSLS